MAPRRRTQRRRCATGPRAPDVPASLWRAVDAELDARILSPAARLASRQQGGHLLRLALRISRADVLDALARTTAPDRWPPHHAVVIGTLASAAGASPEDAAYAAALAALAGAGPSAAAELLPHLGRGPALSGLGADIASEVKEIADRAGRNAMHPLSRIPSFGAPALEYLAEQHAAGKERSFAS